MTLKELFEIYLSYDREVECPVLSEPQLQCYSKSHLDTYYTCDRDSKKVVKTTFVYGELTNSPVDIDSVTEDDFDVWSRECVFVSAAISSEYSLSYIADVVSNLETADVSYTEDNIILEFDQGFITIMDYDNAAELFRGRYEYGLSEPTEFSNIGLNDISVVGVFNANIPFISNCDNATIMFELFSKLVKYLNQHKIKVENTVSVKPIFL